MACPVIIVRFNYKHLQLKVRFLKLLGDVARRGIDKNPKIVEKKILIVVLLLS
jgi:hypothetical protein